jgi:hypothetical protein
MALEQLGHRPPVSSPEVIDQFAFRFLLHGRFIAVGGPSLQLVSIDDVT